MKKTNELLNDFITNLKRLLEREEMSAFDKELIRFKEWTETLSVTEQEMVLTLAIPEVTLFIKKAEDKKKMYEEIGMDNASKRGANQKYSQY